VPQPIARKCGQYKGERGDAPDYECPRRSRDRKKRGQVIHRRSYPLTRSATTGILEWPLIEAKSLPFSFRVRGRKEFRQSDHLVCPRRKNRTACIQRTSIEGFRHRPGRSSRSGIPTRNPCRDSLKLGRLNAGISRRHRAVGQTVCNAHRVNLTILSQMLAT
jgi:hypothetical protein